MNILHIWDNVNDLIGATPLHPQYFVITAEKASVNITLRNLKSKVLDIGCGRQLLRSPIEAMGLSYTSLDHPKIYHRQRSGRKPDILADIVNLPINNNSYDSVLLLMVIAHLPKPYIALKEVYRVLKRNGLLFISCPENYPAHDLPDDFYRYRTSGLKELCRDVGFKIIQIYSWGNVWQVNAINFNMYLLQTAKYVWDKKHNLLITILILIISYPFMLIANLVALLLTPLDFLKSSRLINFAIVQK